jgi:hypothetical protein
MVKPEPTTAQIVRERDEAIAERDQARAERDLAFNFLQALGAEIGAFFAASGALEPSVQARALIGMTADAGEAQRLH